MSSDVSTRAHQTSTPQDVLSVGSFLGTRFKANLDGRVKNYMLSEQFIQQHELKNNDDWFWNGEQIGKWLDSAAYSGLIAKDQPLLDRVHEVLERLARSQEADGYIGITVFYHRNPVRGMQLYEWYYVLHGLLACVDLLNSPTALTIAKRLGEYIIRVWGTEPGQFPLVGLYPGNGHTGGEGSLIIEPIVMLGSRLNDSRFIDWAERVVDKWDAWLKVMPESVHTCGYREMQQFASGEKQIDELRDNLHAHTFHMALLGIAALYNVTGKTEYRDAVIGCVDRIASDWILLTGGMSSGERYISPRFYHATGEIEVCPQHTWILLLEQVYRWTGQAKYFEPLERDVFNQLLAAQLADGSNWSYMTPMNGHAQEPVHPNCCNAAGQRILSRLPTYLVGLHENSPAVLLFSTSQTVVHAPDLPPIRIEQTTDFPASGDVTITVSPESPATFALHVRIPPYASGFTVRVNGETIDAKLHDGFLIIDRAWQSGDTIALQLPMPLSCHANAREVAIMRGPLIYALFQYVQSAHQTYHWHRTFHPDEAELVIDPAHPERSLQEANLPTTFGSLLGPALRVTGRLVQRTPVFASVTMNQALPSDKDEAFLLLPYANQGAVRGEYQVFSAYQKS